MSNVEHLDIASTTREFRDTTAVATLRRVIFTDASRPSHVIVHVDIRPRGRLVYWQRPTSRQLRTLAVKLARQHGYRLDRTRHGVVSASHGGWYVTYPQRQF